MTFCYILMAHTGPDQVAATTRRIRALSPDAEVIVRHATEGVFDADALAAAGAAEFRSATQMLWGDWSLVLGAVEVLRHALATTTADHLVLLSGQDYPIRDLAAWEREVAETGVDALVDTFPTLPEDWTYSWRRFLPPQQVPRQMRRVVAGVWRRVNAPLRELLLCYDYNADPRWYCGLRRFRRGPIPVVKGSLWMTLTRAAAQAVVDGFDHDSRTRRWFEHVRIPDESYVQSVLAAAPALTWLDCSTTHARFEFGNPNALPLTHDELDLAALGPAAFARKLVGLDAELIAHADRLAARPPQECARVAGRTPDGPHFTGPETRAGEWAPRIDAALRR